MSQEDSGVHSDGSYPTSERKHSTPVTAKELKVTWNYCFNKDKDKDKELKVVTWNYCFKDNNEDFLVEQQEENLLEEIRTRAEELGQEQEVDQLLIMEQVFDSDIMRNTYYVYFMWHKFGC